MSESIKDSTPQDTDLNQEGAEWQNLDDSGEESLATDMSEDDQARYEAWMQKREAGEEDEDFYGEKNEAPVLKNGKPVYDENGNMIMRKRAAEGNKFDYHNIQKGEHAAIEYKARLEWEKLAEQKAEEFPWTEDDQRYDEYGNRDRKKEQEDWRAKANMPSYEEYLADFKRRNGYETADDTATAETGEEETGESYWHKIGKEGQRELVHKHPRKMGESNEQWAKRIEEEEGRKIFSADMGANVSDGENDSGSGTQEEHGETIVAEAGEEVVDEAHTVDEAADAKDGGESPEDKKDAEDKKAEEGKEDKEAKEDVEKERLLKIVGTAEFATWLKEKGLTNGDVEGKTPEELQALIDERNKEKAEHAEKEKERLLLILGAPEFATWLKEKGLTNGDVEGKTPEELQALVDEYNAEHGEKPTKKREKLILASVDLEKDAKDAARIIAEDMLDETLHKGGFFGRFVKGVVWGQMFREGVLQRYQKQAMEMIIAKQNGEATDLSNTQWSGSKAGLERFVTAYVMGAQEELISKTKGEKMDVFGMEMGEDGAEHAYRFGVDKDGNRTRERLDENSTEAKVTKNIRDAIANYAQGKLSKEQFESEMHLAQQDMNGESANLDLMISNYMNVAEAARESFDHSKSINDVMEGFTFINGEARRDPVLPKYPGAINRITEALTESRIGRYVPPEVLGTAASLATTFGRSGLRNALIGAGAAVVGASLAPAAVPIAAGMVISAAGAAVRENRRVNVDRTVMMRRIARGEEVGDSAYDKALAKTMYEVKGSESYASDLEKALDSGKAEDIQAALATAEAAVALTDGGKLLIDYGETTEARETNTQELGLLRARAKAELKKQGISFDSDAMTKAIEGATRVFEKDIKAKDAAFARQKIWKVLKQSGKSAAVTGVVSVGAQEAVAVFSRNMSGVLDRALGMKDNPDAQSTLLAGALGLNKRVIPVNAEAASNVRLSAEEQARLREEGYTITKGTPEKETVYEKVSGEEYFRERGNAECTSWLNNGTTRSDGTELQGYFRQGEGPFTVARGVATNPATGESYDLSQMGDKIKIYIRPTADSAPIALDGMRVGDNIMANFTGVDEATAEMAQNGSYYMAQIGIPTGVKDGMETFSSIASFRGTGQLPAEVTRGVEKVYDTVNVIGFDKTIERAVAAFPALGAARRKNLTRKVSGKPDTKVPKVNIPRGGMMDVSEPVKSTETKMPETSEETAPKPPESTESGAPEGSGPTAPGMVETVTTTTTPETSTDGTKAEDSVASGVLTEEYRMIDAKSEKTDVIISDENMSKYIPAERLDLAREMVRRWNSMPVESRRKYLETDSDDGLDIDAGLLDVAKTMEAFGLIKSGRKIDLAAGVTVPKTETSTASPEKKESEASSMTSGRKVNSIKPFKGRPGRS